MPNNLAFPASPSASTIRRSASNSSLHSDLSGNSYLTARTSVGPPPFSRGAGPASTGSASPADSYRSAASRPAAPHTTIEMTALPASTPAGRADTVRKVHERVAAQVALLSRSLHADAEAGTLRVPPDFVAPHGADRYAAYADLCGRDLDAFATRISQHIVDEGFDDESLMKAFEAVTRKDHVKSTIVGALERLPLIASLALMNCMLPFAEAASKADPSANWRSGLVTSGLTNAAAAVVQQAYGPHIRAVVSGPDPYITKPPMGKVDPAVVRALNALSPVTLAQRFEAAWNGAGGVIAGVGVGGVASTLMTGAGVPTAIAVPAAIATRATTQLLATGPASAAANGRLDRRQHLQGLLTWVARTKFAETARHAHDPWMTVDNATQVLKTGARVVATPVTALLPRRWMPTFMASPDTGSEWVPPAVQNFDHPAKFIGPVAFGVAGAVIGSHDGKLSNELAQVVRPDRLQATMHAGLRAAGAAGGGVATASSYALGNATAAELIARRARAAGIATTAVPAVAADVQTVAIDEPAVPLEAAVHRGAGRSSSSVHQQAPTVLARRYSV